MAGMAIVDKKPRLLAGAVGLCGVLATYTVHGLHHGLAGSAAAPAPHLAAHYSPRRSLDLALRNTPHDSDRTAPRPGTVDLKDPDYRDLLPELGPDLPRPETRVEELARRIHREGIPLARLGSSRTAMVSVRFSGHRPGLWFIQKMP